MDRKVYLMSLIVSCPLETALCDCPFNKFRDISILKLIEITHNLTEEEIISIANEHKKCLKRRELILKAS